MPTANSIRRISGPISRVPGPVLWIALVLYSGLIFYVSSRPAPHYPDMGLSHPDKLAHFGAYGVWGGLCAWALRRTRPTLGTAATVLVAVCAGALYGLSDEVHQSFVPSRDADAMDLLADSAGALAGALCVALLCRVRGARKSPVGGAPRP
jgi:hypothetical protein